MKQMICYLYEFHNDQKIRNVGFVRIIPYTDKVMMQFHGKGLSFRGVEDLEVFLFYMRDDTCYVTSIGRMDGVHGTINHMIEVTGDPIIEGEGLEQYDGILIRQPQGQIYVATWNNVEVDVEHMQEAGVESELEPELEVEEDSEIEATPELKEEVDPEEENEIEVISEQDSEEELAPDAIPTPEEESYTEPEDSVQQATAFPRYEKIVRQDIARLPRKEWKLANNSFLLHGFYNYKHLLFIQEQEQLYLGVPGVYHKKEQEAALGFGFNQFHRVEEDLGLSEDERNDMDDFGYWCRPVEQLHPD